MKINIQSNDSQSNSGYHRTGKPNWWVAAVVDGSMQFVDCEKVRGDHEFSGTVEIPDETEKVILGVGKKGRGKSHDAIRVTFTRDEISDMKVA